MSIAASQRVRAALGSIVFVSLLSGPMAPAAATERDAFLAGYASAVLDRELGLGDASVRVRDGVATVRLAEPGEAERRRVADALAGIAGIARVEVLPAAVAEGAAPSDGGGSRDRGRGTADERMETAAAQAADSSEASGPRFLPRRKLFAPLIADPRWPHFGATYQNYMDDPELENVGAVSFGETFALYSDDLSWGGRWELGFQAGVFAIFDLDADSKDLINADYWVGVPVAYRNGDFATLVRLFHQSSHLGDEFLLRNRVDRINLSYESVDLKLSYDVTEPFRVYVGGGYLFNQEPSDLDPWSTQIGAEFEAPWTLFNGRVRPIAAVDLQNRQETDWDSDLSIRAGVQFENSEASTQRIQLLAEYFNGHSPNGQFYERIIEYAGLGVHAYF